MTPDPITPVDTDRSASADTVEAAAGDGDSDDTHDEDEAAPAFEPLTVSPRRAGDRVTVISRNTAAIAVSEFPAYVASDGRVKHRDTDTGFNATQYQVRD